MFCKNCGQQVADGELFCPSCGTAMTAAPRKPAKTGMAGLGANTVLYFIFVGLLGLCSILILCPIMVATSGSFTSEPFGMFAESEVTEGNGFLGFLFFAAYSAGAVLALLPLFTNKPWKSSCFLTGRIASIACLSMFFIIYFLAAAALDAQSWVSVSLGFSFLGWIYILSAIGAVVLSFIVPGKVCAPAPAPRATYTPNQY